MVKVADQSIGPTTKCKGLESSPHALSYTLKTAAQVTGISQRALRRLVKRGLLRPSMATKKFIFSANELTRFLNETTTNGGEL